MPNKIFASSYLKVKRANKHIEEFKSAWDVFLNDNPHTLSFEKHLNTPKTIIKVSQAPLPETFKTIVGDAIHNLRTALDHLACETVRQNGGKIERHHGFPVSGTDRIDFESCVEGKIKGASKDAIDLFKSLDAYKGGTGESLWALSELDVRDKHTSLIIAVNVFSISKLSISYAQGGGVTMENCSVSGAGVMNLITIKGHGPLTIQDDGNSTVDIVFRENEVFENEPVVKTLKQLSQLVLGIINTFEAKFG